MQPDPIAPPSADVCMVLEGTYPYVAGGVSSWVHDILTALSARRFSLLHIGPEPGCYGKPRYALPGNVVHLQEMYCRNWAPEVTIRSERIRGMSRLLHALHRLHTSDRVDDSLLEDLSAADLTVDELLHGAEAFEMIKDVYRAAAPELPFLEFFWHFRAMHAPLVRLLSADIPPAASYHAVSAGYAGVVAACASLRQNRPFLLTEHGIYAREREMELARATWIQDGDARFPGLADVSPLRGFWSRYFLMLSRVAYHRADRIITLSEVNRRRQLEDGADPGKTEVVPNGVDLSVWPPPPASREDRPFRVGFVGRIVPIKDVLTLLRACDIALRQCDLELWIIGPEDEDRAYAARCHELVERLGCGHRVRFLGPRPVKEMYPQLDCLVLTSVSEGQPLVILEAYTAGLPVVATDVGACKELVEGRSPEDARLGKSGFVTRVAQPQDTAAALVKLARDPELRARMGRAGRQRVERFYQLRDVLAAYDGHYERLVSS